MKLNKYSWLAALPMIFTACQEDALVENQQQQDKIYTLSATMDRGAAMSRAQIVVGNEADASAGETFMWNEEDEFALYQKLRDSEGNDVLSTSTFVAGSISEDQKSAIFSTDNPATANKDYMAIYPTHFQIDSWNVKISLDDELDFTNAETDEDVADVWKNYMNRNMCMLATGKLASEGSNALEFKHLCALARVTYTNNTNETQIIESLKFGGAQYFKRTVDYSLLSNNLNGGGADANYLMTYNGGLKVAPGESTDLYAFFLEREFDSTTGKLKLYIKTNSVEKVVGMPIADIQKANPDDTGFKAGKRYWFKVTETAEGLTWNTPKPDIVSDLNGLKTAMADETVTQIKLTNPIVINQYVSFYTPNKKTISMSDEFTWKVGDTEYDAMIVNEYENTDFSYCTIEGSSDVDLDKYLLRVDANLKSWALNLNAGDNMNAVRVADANFYMSSVDEKTPIINVMDADNYALYVTSEETICQVTLQEEGQVNGNVYFRNDFDNEDNWSHLQIDSDWTLDGELNVCGENVQDLRVHLYGQYTGNDKIEVSSLQDFLNVRYNETVDTILLKKPIIITENVSYESVNRKAILMANDFNWNINGEEADALFVNSGELKIQNCTIVGSENSNEDKYILKTTAGFISFTDSELEAKGKMNGVEIVESEFMMQELHQNQLKSIFVESDDKFAFKISSSEDKPASVCIQVGTVKGHVWYNCGNESSNKPDGFEICSGAKLTGNLIVPDSATPAWDISVSASTVEGQGWPIN